MNRIIATANVIFGKYLLITNTISSSVLMAVGDSIEQKAPWNKCRNESKHDWQRTSNMLRVGCCLGPLQHLFYKIIDERYPCRSWRSIMKKVLLDQTIASPAYIAAFFISCGIVEHRTDKCIDELKTKFVDIYMIDWLVWPPSQVLNFLFLSPKYRMLYVNCTTMVYDIFLAYIKYEDETDQSI